MVCEANKTHTGLDKNFNFNPKIPEKYKEKIIYIKVTDLPNIEIKGKKDYKLLSLQMESVEAWEQIDESLAIPDFEVILLGPADLSASLGFPGDDATNPKQQMLW